MNLNISEHLRINRRHFFGRASIGIGTAALASLLNPQLFAEEKANHRLMIARGNWYADYNDPTTFLNCLVTGNGNNDSGYSSLRYDELMAQARDSRDPRRRAERAPLPEGLPLQQSVPVRDVRMRDG